MDPENPIQENNSQPQNEQGEIFVQQQDQEIEDVETIVQEGEESTPTEEMEREMQIEEQIIFSERIVNSFNDAEEAILCISIIDNKLFSGGMDDNLRVYDIQTGKNIHTQNFGETISFFAKNYDSSIIAIADLNETITFMKTSDFSIIHQFKTEYDELTVSRISTWYFF